MNCIDFILIAIFDNKKKRNMKNDETEINEKLKREIEE
jgi:hypothetical protein